MSRPLTDLSDSRALLFYFENSLDLEEKLALIYYVILETIFESQ